MTNNLFPALIIGAGGTGVKVVRFLQSLANEGIVPDLKHHLESGSIQLIAIDTDPKSNECDLQIDPNLIDARNTPHEEREKIPSRLHRLPKNCIILEREAINQAISKVYNEYSLGAKSTLDEDDPDQRISLKSIRKWFPLKTEGSKDYITLGHSKQAGAAQWRPLGRMAFFLNASRIYEALQKPFRIVQQSDPEQRPLRAFIICSLAGGTGSGLFWDLAFYLQMLDGLSQAQTTGMFLLGDPFEGVDEAGRIYPNVYAALKEIAQFKNWREPLSVEYPIGKGKVFNGHAQGGLAYDMIYLYQSFPAGQDAADRAKATIEATCLRIAQNLLAMLRKDLHAEMDVGANNMDSDTTSMLSQPESTYCFSTTGTTIFNLRKPEELQHYFFTRMQKKLESLASLNEKSEEEQNNVLHRVGLPIAPPQEMIASFRNELLDELGKEKPTAVVNLIKKLETSLSMIKDRPAEPASKLVHETLGEADFDFLDQIKKSSKNSFPINNLANEHELKIEKAITSFKDKIQKCYQEQLHSTTPLSTEVEMQIETLLELQILTPLTDKDMSETQVEIPKAFKKFRWEEELSQDYGGLEKFYCEPPRLIYKINIQALYREAISRAIKSLKDALEKACTNGRDLYRPIFDRLWGKHFQDIQKILHKMLSHSKTLRQHQSHFQNAVKQLSPSSVPKQLGSPSPEVINAFFTPLQAPSTSGDLDEWITNHARKLLTAVQQAVQPRDPASFGLHQRPELIETALRNFTKDILSEIQSHNTEACTSKLLDLILEFFEPQFRDGEIEVPPDYFEVLVEVLKSVVNYWNDQGNALIQQAGGENALKARILRCKTKLFVNGLIENKLNKSHLLILPNHAISDQDPLGKRKKEETSQLLDLIAQNTLQTRSFTIYGKTDSPIIFFNDLFRSAEEIFRIRQYYEAYMRYSERGNASLYHLDKEWAGLPEIVGEAIKVEPVRCGNANCDYNLHSTRRTEINCPKCKGPIWNRCGNKGCNENHLFSLVKEKTENGKFRFPYECPSCGGELKTYWWKCNDPCHVHSIPADKETCPECLVEFQNGKRSHQELGRRPDLGHIECPGCLSLNDQEALVQVPNSLTHYYEDGVNGHDTLIFASTLERLKKDYNIQLGSNACPNPDALHFLFPTCPKDQEVPNKRHHVYRNTAGRFSCTHHPDLRFYECNRCHYPIIPSEGNCCKKCPRCFSQVRHCTFCSDKYLKLYNPLKNKGQDRCPNCMNFMDLYHSSREEEYEWGVEEAAFCPNLFTCKAGHDIWSTSTEYGLKVCRVCPDTASPLFHRAELHYAANHCPLCALLLSPRALGFKVLNHQSAFDLVRIFENRFRSGEPIPEKCTMCGTSPKMIWGWMVKSGFIPANPDGLSLHLQSNEDTQEVLSRYPYFYQQLLPLASEFNQKLPPFYEAYELLAAVRQYLDDRRCFQAIRANHTPNDLMAWKPVKFQQILAIFPAGAPVSLALKIRLDNLLGCLEEINSRTAMWTQKSGT